MKSIQEGRKERMKEKIRKERKGMKQTDMQREI